MTTTQMEHPDGLLGRVRRFWLRPRHEKFKSFYNRWVRRFPRIPVPVRLPFGAWWLMDTDFIGESLLGGGYEAAESDLARRFLRPGMIVVDIGAHRGFHTLLFSQKVGNRGRVFSVEPSPSDCRRLRLHLKINFCRNVEVIQCALGEEELTASLYAVPANSVLNSLRPPDTSFQVSATPVQVRKLDDVLSQRGVKSVDFVKLDVEGGELGVLRGARELLSSIPRPTILCEVLEQRTRPWGYPSRLIVEHLVQMGFVWFELDPDATLRSVEAGRSEFNGNFVAVPRESVEVVTAQLRSVAGGVSRGRV